MEAIERITQPIEPPSRRGYCNPRTRSRIAVLLFGIVLPIKATFATGTPAGTEIVNTATVNFEVDGAAREASASNSFSVAEVIDVVVVWQDGANIQATSPDTDRVLTFLVTNIGNGNETFSLKVNNNLPGADSLDPEQDRVFLDGNDNGLFDGAATDPPYSLGGNDPLLDVNGRDRITVFVMNNIPGGFKDDDAGESQLIVAATTGGAAGDAPGTTLAGLGDGGVDAVVGLSRASGDAIGTYQIKTSTAAVTLTKRAVVISNDQGCHKTPCAPTSGATIRYTIKAKVARVPVQTLRITDPIPPNTTYVANSISLNTARQTDSTDSDAGSFVSNRVDVNLGDITRAITYAITFDVTIK